MQHIGQVVGVGHEGFGHEAMHLERLALQPDAAVALAVVGGYRVPRGGVALGLGSAEHVAVAGDEVEGAALLVELLIEIVIHTLILMRSAQKSHEKSY